jgi:CHAT domain-containing protein
MVKEGQWVAKQFNTELEIPCPSVFDALHHLANQKQAHICTHGKFDRNNPLASGLITVVGTLWPCNGLATLCFNYYFYKQAQPNPQMPWHIVAAKARKALKQMRQEDLENIATEFNLENRMPNYRH